MLFLLRQSPVARHLAKLILEEPAAIKSCEEVVKKVVDRNDTCCEFQKMDMKSFEMRIEQRLREVEKKTDGLREFLSKV